LRELILDDGRRRNKKARVKAKEVAGPKNPHPGRNQG
jgi:hypothetical protein